jgi:endonuclease-3
MHCAAKAAAMATHPFRALLRLNSGGPPRWRDQLKAITSCRRERTAPVDIIGCGSLADPILKDSNPPAYRFQALVAGLLSSQTKDEVTAAAMERLQEHGCCSIRGLLRIEQGMLERILHPVSFYKRKAGYLKKCASALQETGDIPPTAKAMQKLPGVGPKVSFLVAAVAWGNAEGICVDTHVHRISNRLHWVDTKQPEQTRVALQKFLPHEYWWPLNQLLVGFGQQMCSAVRPLCVHCPLALELCAYGKQERNSELNVLGVSAYEPLNGADDGIDMDPGATAAAAAEAFADAHFDPTLLDSANRFAGPHIDHPGRCPLPPPAHKLERRARLDKLDQVRGHTGQNTKYWLV